MRTYKLTNQWKETLHKATEGDIYLDPKTEYFAEVSNTQKGQLIDILETPYKITLPIIKGLK